MKSTAHFKNAIKAYLDRRAASDEFFAETYAKPKKNIDECITCILHTVKKSGCNGFADEEIYSMAVHYYDEDNIEAGQPVDCQIMVNHVVELTDEEKEEARKKAMQRAIDEAYSNIKHPAKKKTSASQTEMNSQPNLFDF